MKSGSESSLSETENTKEASRLHEEKEECSDNESSNGSNAKPSLQNNHASLVVLRRKSRGNPMFRKSEGGGRADSEGTQTRYCPTTYKSRIKLFIYASAIAAREAES